MHPGLEFRIELILEYNFLYISITSTAKCPFATTMGSPKAASGGDSLQAWRVAANVLHKQSRTVDQRRSSSLVLGEVLMAYHRGKSRRIVEGLG